jgi:large subunit ribosomal protein L4
MKLEIKDLSGKQQGECEIPFDLVENGRGTQAVHDTVVAYMANQRMGTASAKTVGEVTGSNKKPWRQKGTGRARAGSVRSPLWAGGGVVFGPRPRDFSKKLNTKTRQLALRKALSERLKAGDVQIVADFNLDSHKAKAFAGTLKSLGVDGSALVVDAVIEKNLALASRNIPNLVVTTADRLNTYQVLRPNKLVISRGALDKLAARLKA